MKRTCKFQVASYILVITFMLLTIPSAFAHSSSQAGILAKTYIGPPYDGYYIGGEEVGWSIDEGLHTNGTTITYSFVSSDPYLTSQYRSYVTNGARKWSGTVTITNKTDGSGTGKIGTFYSPNTGIVAVTRPLRVNNSGHLTAWEISMNRAYSQSDKVLAHEFGHVIGLNDLYASRNSGKIMYAYTSGTATSPTTTDKWGAKVITGVHSTHSWGYKYHSTLSSGANRHVKYCTSCYGLTNSVTNCVYNSQNTCIYCGIPRGAQPWAFGYENQ